MKYVSAFLFFLLSAGTPRLTLAQPLTPPTPVQGQRLELPLEMYNSDVQVLPMPQDSSLLLLVDKNPLGNRRLEYSIQKYDHRLQPRWTKALEVPREFEMRQLSNEGNCAYVLFQSESVEHRLWVAAINGDNGQVKTFSFDTKLARSIYDLKVIGGNLFVSVLVDNHLTILLLDLAANKFQFLPSVYEPLPTQLSFLADSAARRAEFVLSQTNGFKNRLQLKQLSAEGKLLRSEFVQAESERGLISAQISPATDSASGRLLAGTYTLRDARYSQGLFAADLSAGVTPTGSRRSLRFYDFANLKHFFDFMSPSRAARLRRRSEKMRASDKVLRLHYRTLIHDLVPFQGGYVMVAEIYYPQYRQNNYGMWGGPFLPYSPYRYGNYNNNNWYGGSRQAEGYRITHALVCGFDNRGNLLWDNTFVLKDVYSNSLTETVHLRPLPDGQRVAIAYLDQEKFNYKVIDHSAPSPNDLHVELQTSALPTVKEKATSTNQERLLTWYGSKFLAFGYQNIRTEKAPNREVFFVNVIGFE
ncbi:hypothetical protein J0X19_15320 [Hymenobacter sp. BT186]|uniref:Uncharacterized protein n=1 Tax=Hymenobacter telluris TaxID=2816474 RepID=A0A939EZ89_9BACT|nr:hypothetical protein [Hymenobacter telluris]MBO0359332.1 hypothetical protein [Hymenobacter telluris]MBW3375358.1 hypothetical protein [Hymenobacter norwichensis]